MLDSSIKSKIDGLWNSFWSGAISNPLTVIEQMSYLIFIKKKVYEDPKVKIARILELEEEIIRELWELEGMID